MTRTLRLAALQLEASQRTNFEEAWPRHVAAIERAAPDCELLVLPEASIPAYVLGDDAIDDALVERAIDDVRAIAQRHHTVIVAGVAKRVERRLRNRALVIEQDGSVAGYADKIFLWHFDRKWFESGNSIEPIDTSVGRLGVMVCADGRIPSLASALVDRGAELLVMPTAWVTSGRNPAVLENMQADLLARVRAFENGVPFVAANKCGVELGMVAYCGKSQIVDANGEFVALASESQPDYIAYDLQICAPAPHRSGAATALREAPPLQAANVRVAISLDESDALTHARLATLDAPMLITPSDTQADQPLAMLRCKDDEPLDPDFLVAARRLGYRIVTWEVRHSSPWTERIARARALELRIYVIVFDRVAERAYAIDPDGTIVAGTFGAYRLASFSLDLERTLQTFLAPSTDILDGLARVATLAPGEV